MLIVANTIRSMTELWHRLFLYGGHTVIVDKADKSELERVHDDLWALDLKTFGVGLLPLVECSVCICLKVIVTMLSLRDFLTLH